MKSEQNGWCVVNFSHPATGKEIMIESSLSGTRKQSIENFIKGSNQTWKHWYRSWGFRCVKVKSIIQVLK